MIRNCTRQSSRSTASHTSYVFTCSSVIFVSLFSQQIQNANAVTRAVARGSGFNTHGTRDVFGIFVFFVCLTDRRRGSWTRRANRSCFKGSRSGRYRSVISQKMRQRATADGVTGVADDGPFYHGAEGQERAAGSGTGVFRRRGTCVYWRCTKRSAARLLKLGILAAFLVRTPVPLGCKAASRVCSWTRGNDDGPEQHKKKTAFVSPVALTAPIHYI